MDGYLGQLPQEMINGLTLGGIYALIAVGYTMVYGILSMLNFAHGEIYMIGGFAGWWTLDLLTKKHGPLIHAGILILMLIVVAMTVGAFLGMTVERFAYRPLRKSPRMNLLVSALGVSLFLQAVVLAFHGGGPRFFPAPALIPESLRIFYLGNVVISLMRVIVIAASVLLIALLVVIMKKTSLGKAIRATMQDRAAAMLSGIDTERMTVIVFLMGSALGGAAGTLAGMLFTQVHYASGLQAGVKGFTAAVLGGMGNVFGAVVGGIILGLLEALAAAAFPAAYKDLVAFSVLVLVLVFRPWGLMGEKPLEKI